MANPETNPFEAPKSDDRESTKQVEHARQKPRAFHLGHLVGWLISYGCSIALATIMGFNATNLIVISIASTFATISYFTGLSVLAIFLMWIAIGMQFAWRERSPFFQVLRVGFWALAWIVWNMIGMYHCYLILTSE